MYKKIIKKTVKLIPIFIIVILMMAACDNGVQLNGDNGETEINYNLTLTIEGEGQINSDDGSKILDSNEGNKTIEYDEDATVKVVAEAATDYSFSHWSGDITENDAEKTEISLLMDSDKELKAHFISDNAARVEDVASFNDALADEEVELIILEADISGDLIIERDIEIISDGTNKYQFEGQLTLGTGEDLIISLENLIVNSLIIDAGQGKVYIIDSNVNELDLKSIGENSLDVNGSDILTLTINTMSRGRINLGERTKVNNFIANGEIEVVGAKNIQRAVINNEQVSLDRPPQEIDEEESEIENPENVIEEDLYTVSFIIRDAEDNLLSDVTVLFADEEKLTEDGYVEFNDIEPGNYDYKIEKTGFRSIEGSFDITGYQEFDLTLREELADGVTEVTTLEELEAALINGNVDIIYIANDITGDITIRRDLTILGGNNSIDEIIIDADNSSIILEDLNVEVLSIKSAGHGSRGLYILGNSQVEEVFLTEINWVNIQIDGMSKVEYMFIDGMSEYIWVTGSARNIDLLENQGWYIYFSEEPGDYGDEHWDNPHILFEPGEGGQLEDYPPPPVFQEEPGMFSGFYVYRSHRGRFAVNWADYSEVYFRFDHPNVHGATSYTLEYSDDDRETWQPYIRNDEVLVTDNNNIVLTRVDGEYWYRLKLNDGPYEGYTSNEVFAELSNVRSQFAGWSSDDNLYDDEPYIGRKNIIIRTTIINESYEISDEYLTYQWYRVNPVTFEMEELGGETDNRYYLTSADVGYDHILRANGDGENIGGFQQFLFRNSSQYAKDKNPAYISEIALDRVRLNLYYETLEPLNPGDFYLVAYDSEYNEIIIEVNDVISIEDNSVYDIMVDLPEDLFEIYLNINSDFWELQKFGDYHHWTGGISIYKLPDL